MISVIMPVYNAERYLERSICSVLNQTYTDLELILVNDNSNDGSKEICMRFQGEDRRVHIVSHKCNCGISCSRLDGLLASTGEWISYMDDDDIIAPDYLNTLHYYSEDNDIITANGLNIISDKIEGYIWEKKDLKNPPVIISGKQALSYFFINGSLVGRYCRKNLWGKLIKRSIVEKAVAIAEKYKDQIAWLFMEDGFFVPIIYSIAGNVAFGDKVQYLHRCYLNSTSQSIHMNNWFMEVPVMYDILLQYLKSMQEHESYLKCIEGAFLYAESVWYRCAVTEKKNPEIDNCIEQVDILFNKYYSDYVKDKTKKCSYYINTTLFYYNKQIWKTIIGIPYFCLLLRLKREK